MEITSREVASFRAWSDAELADAAEMLCIARGRCEAGEMTKTRFEALQMGFGINCNPSGIFADRELLSCCGIVSAVTYDWVHNLFQDGIFTTEGWLFLNAAGIPSAEVQQYLKCDTWEYPYAFRQKSKQLHRVFDHFRSHSSDEASKLKASASELLGLYGLLRHLAETRIGDRPDISAQRASFDALCHLIDLIVRCKRGKTPPNQTSDNVQKATLRYMELHEAAYGTAFVKPKMHWQLDMSQQIARDGCILDAFIIERMHLTVKRVAETVQNTSCFERSVFSGVINHRFLRASDGAILSGLGYPNRRWRNGWVSPYMTYQTLQALGAETAHNPSTTIATPTATTTTATTTATTTTATTTTTTTTTATTTTPPHWGCTPTLPFPTLPLALHKVAAGDVVAHGEVAGQVVACFYEDGALAVLVDVLQQVFGNMFVCISLLNSALEEAHMPFPVRKSTRI